MSTTSDALNATVQELLTILRATGQGELPLDDIDRLEDIVRCLGYDEPTWISIPEATSLLGRTNAGVVPALVQLRLIRGRTDREGQLEVRFVDMLHERMVREGLLAFGGDDMTEEELEIMYAARPGTTPWEREARQSPQ